MKRVNVFDFDGVLIDSKEAHWKFYSDFAHANGFSLRRRDFEKAISGQGELFWENLGVPDEHVRGIQEDYTTEFWRYPVTFFGGVPEMLERLSASGAILTLATFNRRANVERAVKEHIKHFERVFTFEDGRKEGCVQKLFDIYGGTPSDYRLIGDTRWDKDTSEGMGIGFLAVNYGWMKFRDDGLFPIVETVAELQDYLLRHP